MGIRSGMARQDRARNKADPARASYPEANIIAVDYDPGASEVNQLNRIKLMLSTARDREKDKAAVG